MPGTQEPAYGQRKANRTGLIVTVLLHLLIVAIYFLQPNPEKSAKPPAGGARIAGRSRVKTSTMTSCRPQCLHVNSGVRTAASLMT